MFTDTNTLENQGLTKSAGYYEGQRGTFGDIMHSLWAGTGEALSMTGYGLESLGMDTAGDKLKGAGEWIGETEYAKEDLDTYLGRDGRVKRVATGVARSLPAMAAPVVAGVAGATVGTPLTGVAVGGAVMGTMFGAGTYGQSYEEAINAGLSESDAKEKGLIDAALELGTEALGTGVGFLTFGTGKGLVKIASKKALDTAVKSKIISPEQVLKAVAKEAGTKQTIAKLIGAPLTEGGSEVVNAIGQDWASQGYGMGEKKQDLIDTFLIGATMGTAMGTAGTISSAKQDKQGVENYLKENLSGPNADLTANSIYKAINKVDPHLAGTWKEYYRLGGRDLDVSFEELSQDILPPKETMEREVELYEKNITVPKQIDQITDPVKAAEIVEDNLNPTRIAEKDEYKKIARAELDERIDGKLTQIVEPITTKATPAPKTAASSALVFMSKGKTIPMKFAEGEMTAEEVKAIKEDLVGAKSDNFKGIVTDLMEKHTRVGMNNIMDMLVAEYQNTTNLKHRKALGDEITEFFAEAEKQFGSTKGKVTTTPVTPEKAARSIDDIQDAAEAMVNVKPTEISQVVQSAVELDPVTTDTQVYQVDTAKDAAIAEAKEAEFAAVEGIIEGQQGIAPELIDDVVGDVTENTIEAKTNTNTTNLVPQGQYELSGAESSVEQAFEQKEAGVSFETFSDPEPTAEVEEDKSIWQGKMVRSGAMRSRNAIDSKGKKWTMFNNGDGIYHVLDEQTGKVVASFDKKVPSETSIIPLTPLVQATKYIESKASPFVTKGEKVAKAAKKSKETKAKNKEARITRKATVIRRGKKRIETRDTVVAPAEKKVAKKKEKIPEVKKIKVTQADRDRLEGKVKKIEGFTKQELSAVSVKIKKSYKGEVFEIQKNADEVLGDLVAEEESLLEILECVRG